LGHRTRSDWNAKQPGAIRGAIGRGGMPNHHDRKSAACSRYPNTRFAAGIQPAVMTFAAISAGQKVREIFARSPAEAGSAVGADTVVH
jgi:hypothetical protein